MPRAIEAPRRPATRRFPGRFALRALRLFAAASVRRPLVRRSLRSAFRRREGGREEFDLVGVLGGVGRLRPQKCARRPEQRHAQDIGRHQGKQGDLSYAPDFDVVGEPSQQKACGLRDVGRASVQPVHEDGVDAAVARRLGALHHHDEHDERKCQIGQPREQAQARLLQEREQHQAGEHDREDGAKHRAQAEAHRGGEPKRQQDARGEEQARHGREVHHVGYLRVDHGHAARALESSTSCR